MTSQPSANAARLLRRAYGAHGDELSIIGFGGIVISGMEQARANRLVAEAIERGVNYFDVAPTYGDAEQRLGPALKPYRNDVFLACKTTQRQADAARAEFEQSLQRLHTGHFDLYQLHGLTDVAKDVDAAFAREGVMSFLVKERKAGRIRHLGFSAHSIDAALTAMDRFDFDSILFPVNFATFYEGNFGPTVIERAKGKNVARLALKTLARQKWPANHPDRARYKNCWYQPVTDPNEADLALRFTLSQPVTAALPPGEESLFRMAMDLAMNFRPLNAEEDQQVRTMAHELAPIFTA